MSKLLKPALAAQIHSAQMWVPHSHVLRVFHTIGLAAHTIGLVTHTIGLAAHTVGLLAHTMGLAAHTVGLVAHTMGLAALLRGWPSFGISGNGLITLPKSLNPSTIYEYYSPLLS
jgi:hypothetical protein